MNQNPCDLVGKLVCCVDGVVYITNESGTLRDPFDGAVPEHPTEDEIFEEGAGVYIHLGSLTLTTEHLTFGEGRIDVFQITGVKK